ncbi:GGDEF domain-containing protein [Salisediminibacterium beveridgei]|uniref:Putative diguanylate cyclase (GGDEF domain) n=1 Tax=Salisediminibacterium beveridgei TaxID=632773 RepID=A0A1D7QSH2_9BACI|nr:GGDEF domain-containing protein [Salisediminibacterium beveridgei]AOM81929.1 putative diguanylate cyclase (GGDEF domain) [Salisediminibacterium beveridgei]
MTLTKEEATGLKHREWIDKTIKYYWYLIIVAVAAEIFAMMVTLIVEPQAFWSDIRQVLVYPTVAQVTVLIVISWVYKKQYTENEYLLMVVGTILAFILVASNNGLAGAPLILLLPMMISILFFNRNVVIFSYVTNVLAYLLAVAIFPDLGEYLRIYEFIAYVYIFSAGFIILLAVQERTDEVIEILRQKIDQEQELMVRNTIMERLSKLDAPTGLYNHKTFQEYFSFLFDQSRGGDYHFQLAMLDIDDFKQVNDTYGHAVGDKILERIARVIDTHVDANDIASRYGGEEFAILFTGSSFDDAKAVMENIRESTKALQHTEMGGVNVTISCGLVAYEGEREATELFDRADRLLYQAKENGKNRVETDYLPHEQKKHSEG